MQGLGKKIGLALAVLLLFACSGGGCSTCEGCGVEPIPGGFPNDDRVSNSAQVRLTESGIGFLEDNIGDIVSTLVGDGLAFDVPPTSEAGQEVCPDDDCVAQVIIPGESDIGPDTAEFTPTPPNTLRLHLRLIIESRNKAGEREAWDLDLTGGDCTLDVDTREGSRGYVGVAADVRFIEETRGARAGYTRVVVENANLADGEGLENDDLDVDGPTFSTCFLGDLGFVKEAIIDAVTGELPTLLNDALGEQLCTTQGEVGCPTGSVPASGDTSDPDATCVFEGTDECVPILLGADGQGDLGEAALSDISPGTHAPGQFLLAAGGEGEAVNNGMSLFFYGGFRSTDRSFTESPAHNSCVPVIEPPPKPEIPRVDTFRENMSPSGGSQHIGVGISEQFLDHAGYGIFDSGMLCLGAGTRLSQQLSTGLFSLLVPSLSDLTFPEMSSPLAIALRPQQPLAFTIGDTAAGEPLLTAELDQLEIDFYVWSTERYIRFLTFKGDMAIPIDLTVEGGQIVPQLSDINVDNEEVLNSELIEKDPAELAGVLRDVFSMFAGMLGGSIGGFDLPELMGFRLDVPEDGIAGFEEGGDRWLSIFADLELAGGSGYTRSAETSLEVSDLRLDEQAMQVETWGEGELPSVHLWMEGDGTAGVDYEYSYRIDGMGWSDWTRDYHVVAQDRALLFQGRHVIEARSRVAGEPRTADTTPARAEVVVDILPPEVTATRTGEQVSVEAWDVITPTSDLDYRHRKDGGTWSEWAPIGDDITIPTAYADTPVEVEVRDEAGNIGHAEAKIIRGTPNPEGGGCECTVAGRGSGSAALGLLALVGVLAWRRRKSRGGTRA